MSAVLIVCSQSNKGLIRDIGGVAFFCGDSVVISVVVLRSAIEVTCGVHGDDRAATLRVNFVDAAVCEIVDAHAVGQADALIRN